MRVALGHQREAACDASDQDRFRADNLVPYEDPWIRAGRLTVALDKGRQAGSRLRRVARR